MRKEGKDLVKDRLNYLIHSRLNDYAYSILVIALYIGYLIINVNMIEIQGLQYAVMGAISLNTIACFLRKYRREKNRYRDLSRRDSLTELYNLSYFIELGNSILDKGKRISVLFLDIDGFRLFNDTYGYLIGNKLLKQVANFLKEQVKDFKGIVSRLGGDEFVIMLPFNDEEKINLVKNRIKTGLSKESLLMADDELCNVKINCSIGQAISVSENNATMQEVLHIADMNMYYNKYHKTVSSIDYIKYEYEIPEKLKNVLQCLLEKDVYTYVHSINVAKCSVSLAKKFNLPDETIKQIYIAGLVHDLGKCFIANEILRKRGRLTDKEYEIIKDHVSDGVIIVKGLGLSQTIVEGTLYHHERYDGKGYPSGVRGEDIPLVGRIMQVADAFSAMTIKRVYRQVLDLQSAKEELKRNSGAQFDSAMVDKFIEILDRIDNEKL